MIAIAVMMFGAQLGLWEPIVGFGLIRSYMNPIGYGVAALSVIGAVVVLIQRKRGLGKCMLACLLAVGILAPMIKDKLQPPLRLPPIHDISTDTSNPPEFLVLDDNRPGARNTLQYGGAEVAAHQAQTYPDIAPIESDSTAAESYARALELAQSMGWEIVAQDADALRFEASARTAVFAFVDDVVVVVSSQGEGSRVDLCSVSRIGRGDRGVNAARVRDFIAQF